MPTSRTSSARRAMVPASSTPGEHCGSVGRDRSEIVVSLLASCCIAPTHEQAVAEANAYLASHGGPTYRR